jgi:hypothetical protein
MEPPGAPPRLQEGRAEPPSLAARLRFRKVAVLTVTIAASIGAYWLTREVAGEMAARTLSIIIIAGACWATEVLPLFARSPLRLIYGVLGVTAVFSMWMSNTATTAMMLAVVGPTVRRVPERASFRLAILLAVPFGANIGGIGTPIGTPPNAIAYGVLNQAGYDVTFLTWMLVAAWRCARGRRAARSRSSRSCTHGCRRFPIRN